MKPVRPVYQILDEIDTFFEEGEPTYFDYLKSGNSAVVFILAMSIYINLDLLPKKIINRIVKNPGTQLNNFRDFLIDQFDISFTEYSRIKEAGVKLKYSYTTLPHSNLPSDLGNIIIYF